MKSVTARRRVQMALVYASLLALAATFILPLVWMLRSSLMGMRQIFLLPPQWIPNPVHFKNYADALQSLNFLQCFKNTTFVVLMGVSGTVITASVTAYGWARVEWRGSEIWFALSMSSMMLPSAVTLIPVFLGYQKLGLYNTLHPLYLAAWFGGGAYNQFLIRQFYMGIPRELDEAAYCDGAGHLRIFASVILPLSRSVLIVVGMFSFLYYWNDFITPLIYLETANNFTVSLGLQQFVSQYSSQWALLMAAATIAVVPSIIIFLIGQKQLIEGVALTGLKG